MENKEVEFFLVVPYWHIDSRTYEGTIFSPDMKVGIHRNGEVEFPKEWVERAEQPTVLNIPATRWRELPSPVRAKYLGQVFTDLSWRFWDKVPAWSRGAGQPARKTESWAVGFDEVAISQEGEVLSVLRVMLRSGKSITETAEKESRPIVIPTPGTGWWHPLTVGDNISQIREIYEREYAKVEEWEE